MRWVFVAAVLAFSAAEICASEPGSDEAASVVDMSVAAQGVTISAIPAPSPVVEVLNFDDPAARQRAARKLQQAKKKPSPAILLTRTERRQVALLVASNKSGEPHGFTYDQDGGNQSGLDDLDLHRSFSRPKIVDESSTDKADANELPRHIRLRLMLARLKAVEAHALSQVVDSDEALPESILLRLKEARMKAVQAHQDKFG